MTSRTTEQIAGLLNDTTRTDADKVEELLKMRQEARAIERAATESPMATGDAGSSGLGEIDRALEKLGYEDEAHADENSAATL